VFWQFFPAEQVQPLLDEFQKQNPDVTVQMEQLTWQSGLEKITAAVAGGTVPDLCELGSTWFPRFATQGALADWTDSTGAIESQFTLWELARSNGRTYGMPWMVGTRALFWNKTLFAHAGLDTNHAPSTWPELLEATRRVQALGNGVAGYGVNAGERYILFKKYMPYAWSNGGELLSADGKRAAFDSPANVEALELYLALAKHGRTDRQDQLDEAFLQGKLGAQISGAWLFRKIPTQAPDLAYGVALIPKPAADHGTHASFAGGEILVSFSASKNPNGAFRLARFLASKEAALALAKANKAVQPAAVGAVDDPYYRERPNEAMMVEQLLLSRTTPNHPDWLDMEAAIEDEIEQALYGKKTPAAAVRAANARMNEILARTAASAAR
jgi:multiple sugar transport system substrate-binding protein